MKKKLIYVAVMTLIIAVFSENFSLILSSAQRPATKKINTEVFSIFASHKASDIEKAIREAEKKRKEALSEENWQKQIEETLNQLKNGKISLRKVFAETCFVGDSLLNGLEVYNVLNADRLITQVSARLDHLESNIKKIVGKNPEVLILHYGINMLWDNETGTKWFIEDYTELVVKLKKSLPDTRIIVSGIFPVDSEIATDAIFTHIPRHNEALKKMCADTGVEFLDSTELIEDCTDYYSPDGIHFKASFYSEKWLPYIVESKGIIG